MPNEAGSLRENERMIFGRRIPVRTGGSGTALLLLHAAWSDAKMSWSPVGMERSRIFRVVAPDLPGFGSSDPLPRPQTPPRIPTVLLWGAQDHLGMLQYAKLLQEWIPGSVLRLIDDAGHMPQVEQPEAFIDAIRERRET